MKTLYLARHGKSSLEDPKTADHERPLLAEGKSRTKKIQNYIHKNEIAFDIVISSFAIRALETAKLLADAAGYPQNAIKIDPRLYDAAEDVVYDLLMEMEDNKEQVMLVGHNPTLTQFANRYLNPRIDNLPTSALVCIEFSTEKWSDVPVAKAKVKFIITPQTV